MCREDLLPTDGGKSSSDQKLLQKALLQTLRAPEVKSTCNKYRDHCNL